MKKNYYVEVLDPPEGQAEEVPDSVKYVRLGRGLPDEQACALLASKVLRDGTEFRVTAVAEGAGGSFISEQVVAVGKVSADE